ncbi:hypothetical protein ACJJTC_016424 [Scirpophaga incertulas]
MEAPLLPHQHVNKSLNAKIARGLLLKEQQEKEAGNSSITKSMSTPASLQTIVRFQNGSNMSLHHRIFKRRDQRSVEINHIVYFLTAGDDSCKFCKKGVHALPDCKYFKRAMRRNRWKFVRYEQVMLPNV